MENQHRQIKGYRELNQDEIDLMNKIKAQGEILGVLITDLRNRGLAVDGRWVSIGQTHLQEGIMALVRSIAQPTTF